MSNNCVPCRVATALGLTKNICEEHQELDCQDLLVIIEHPDNFSLQEAEEAIAKVAEKASGEAKELIDCVVTLMHGGKCNLGIKSSGLWL